VAEIPAPGDNPEEKSNRKLVAAVAFVAVLILAFLWMSRPSSPNPISEPDLRCKDTEGLDNRKDGFSVPCAVDEDCTVELMENFCFPARVERRECVNATGSFYCGVTRKCRQHCSA
jgi:hypothetical protein